MARQRISKKERRILIGVIFSILAFSLLSQPLGNLVGSIFISDPIRLLFGFFLILGIIWWFDMS